MITQFFLSIISFFGGALYVFYVLRYGGLKTGVMSLTHLKYTEKPIIHTAVRLN